MASQGFSFPPPPPPPPPTQQPPQTYGNTNAYPSQSGYTHHGSHRGAGGGYRGRGRGGMNRGGRGGGTYANANSYGHNNSNNQQGMYGGGYTTPSSLNGYQNGYQSTAQQYATTNQGYPSQTHVSPPTTYPHTTYGGSYATASTGTANVPVQSYAQQPAVYGSATASYPTAQPSSTVTPPMRWSYDNTGAGSFYPGSTNTTSFAPGTYPYPSPHGQKRAFSSAFEKSIVPRVAAPPAVPSFGLPLPAKPPAPVNTSRKDPKKKKRKSNLLGLTPRTDEHESSAEEDNVDEEARYQSQGAAMQVTFRGRTSTLSTAADIQAWLEERKKRFPTQERIDEKKKAQEETKKQRERQREARRKQLERKQQREQETVSAKEAAPDAMDAVAKAKAKAEKLRKKLLKEERRLQKAEADAERAQLVAEASQQQPSAEAQSTTAESMTAQSTAEQSTAAESTTAESTTEHVDQPVAEKDTDEAPSTQTNPDLKEEPFIGPIIPVLASDNHEGDLSDISDSSSLDDSEDEDDDDDAPEEMSSRRDGPERVPPPPRQKSTKACRDFQRRGKCPRGTQCWFAHEPRTKSGSARQPAPPPTKRGLFQMLVAQETQSRDRRVMQAISWLGEEGLLEQPKSGK